MQAPSHLQRTVGSFLALALGDAMGAPFEGGWPERTLWRLLGRTRDGLRRTTDDTQMSQDLAHALLECDGWSADVAASHFARNYRWHRGYGPGAARVLRRIARGTPWQQARLQVYPQGSWGNGGAMRASVAAWWVQAQRQRPHVEGQGNMADAKADTEADAWTRTLAREQAAITHAHPLAQDGAALIAAAVGSAWHLPLPANSMAAWLGHVVRQAQLTEVQAWRNRLAQAMAWLQAAEAASQSAALSAPSPREVAKKLGNGITALDSCITALYVAARFMQEDFTQLVRFVQKMGGDADTIAAMAGSIYGAVRGEQALPAAWLMQLEGHAALRQLAEHVAQGGLRVSSPRNEGH